MAKRIFIVEDDEIITHLIEQILTLKGYDIAGSAASGEEALEKIPKSGCSLVLMDIGLKGDTDGITVARVLGSKISVPIIFVTGNFDDNLLARAKTPNTCGYIIKPFSANDLVSNIEIALFTFRCRAGPAGIPDPSAGPVAEKTAPVQPPAAQAGREPDQSHRIRAGIKHLYDHAFHHQSRGNYAGALQYFIEILQSNPQDTLVWIEKGDVLQKLGRPDDAIEAIDRALRLDPANEYAVCKKCRVLCGISRQAEALDVIESALGRHSGNHATLVEKAMILHEMERNDEAVTTLEHAIQIDRKSGYALGAMGRILNKLNRNQEAMAVFSRALEIEPQNISLWMDVVRLFEQKHKYHTALNIVQRAIEKNPKNEILALKRESLLSKTIPVAHTQGLVSITP